MSGSRSILEDVVDAEDWWGSAPARTGTAT